MEWAIIAYVLGACVMGGLLAGICLADDAESANQWVTAMLIVVFAVAWPAVSLAAAANLIRAQARRVAKRWRSNRYRWSDGDRYWGPFTYANENRPDGRGREHRRVFGIYITSRGDEDDGGFCLLRAHLLGRTLILRLPALFGPHRRWVDTSHYEWSNNPRGGYWEVSERSYGFLFTGGALHVDYGAKTNDSSSTDRSKVWFLPWRSWRHVRFSIYGLEGEHIWSQFDKDRPRALAVPKLGQLTWWDQQRAAEAAAPKVEFEFLDFDKERLTAATQIQEREWRLGEGRFKWLSWFARPKITRSLAITFSGETGKRKGSWKGGTIGHSIEMKPGELHEAAFTRYCAQHDMTYPRPHADALVVEQQSMARFVPYQSASSGQQVAMSCKEPAREPPSSIGRNMMVTAALFGVLVSAYRGRHT